MNESKIVAEAVRLIVAKNYTVDERYEQMLLDGNTWCKVEGYKRGIVRLFKSRGIRIPLNPTINIHRVIDAPKAACWFQVDFDFETPASNVADAEDSIEISSLATTEQALVSMAYAAAMSAARSKRAADAKEYLDKIGISGRPSAPVASAETIAYFTKFIKVTRRNPWNPVSTPKGGSSGTPAIGVKVAFPMHPEKVYSVRVLLPDVETFILDAQVMNVTATYDVKKYKALLDADKASDADRKAALDAIDVETDDPTEAVAPPVEQ